MLHLVFCLSMLKFLLELDIFGCFMVVRCTLHSSLSIYNMDPILYMRKKNHVMDGWMNEKDSLKTKGTVFSFSI
jgi:hypothetical protein